MDDEAWKSFALYAQDEKQCKICNFDTQSNQELILRNSQCLDSTSDIDELARLFESLSISSSEEEPEHEQLLPSNDTHKPPENTNVNTENPNFNLNWGHNLQTLDVLNVKYEEYIQKMERKSVFVNRWIDARKSGSKGMKDMEAKRKRWNAKIRRYISPKNPLMAFQELYGNQSVQVKMVSSPYMRRPVYAASIERDGRVVTASHFSEVQAKQMACDVFFRDMLMKKISNTVWGQGDASTAEDVRNNMDAQSNLGSRLRLPDDEDFPWSQYASIAMDNLIGRWRFNDPRYAEINAVKMFPYHPENFHPVSWLNIMKPYVIFRHKVLRIYPLPVHEMKCTTDGYTFFGLGSTKKSAKVECAIELIKHFWNIDYRSM